MPGNSGEGVGGHLVSVGIRPAACSIGLSVAFDSM